MRFILFNIPSSGHVNPALPLAAELVRRGHRVDFYLTDGYRTEVEATGATFRAYEGVADNYFEEVSRRFNPPRLATQLMETSAELLPGLVEMLREQRPDAVIYDTMCPWGRLAAKAAGLPAVASMALMDLPDSLMLKTGQVLPTLWLIAGNLGWLRRYRRAAGRVGREWGLDVAPFPGVINWPGDLTISYTSELFPPKARRNAASTVFVGPPFQSPWDGAEFPFEELDASRPLVYVSLGTVFNDRPAFFRACIEAFGGGESQLVMAVGDKLSIEAVGPLPPGVIVRPFVPQTRILERASLFVTHSGANSVHDALYCDLPLLLVPQQLEQAMIAARVEQLGAGRVLRSQKVTAGRLAALAARLLEEPGFRANAARIGASLREAGGVVRAAGAIEDFVG